MVNRVKSSTANTKISNSSRKRFERIQKEMDDIKKILNRNGLPLSDNRSTNNVNDRITRAMTFEQVENLDEFLQEYSLWLEEKQIDSQRKKLKERLSALKKEHKIIPGKSYDFNIYFEHVKYILDTMELLGELGEIKKANKLANLALFNSNQENEVQSGFLRAWVFWYIAKTFSKDEYFNKSIDLFKSNIDHMKKKIDKLSLIEFHEDLAERYWLLSRSGVDRDKNLKASLELLTQLALEDNLSLSGRLTYIKVLFESRLFEQASTIASETIKNFRKYNPTIDEISEVNISELAQIIILGKLLKPERFLDEFGPFAAPIYAECNRVSISLAWKAVYQENLDLPNEEDMNIVRAILMNNVVFYEKEADHLVVMMHENFHSSVNAGSCYKSEGQWFKVYRDVPTASLFTYLWLIGESLNSQKVIPKRLQFCIEFGRRVVKDEPEGFHRYIDNMLKYFEKITEETNSSYWCAAILAGILLEIIGLKGSLMESQELMSYVFHLEFMNHEEALQKAKRKVQVFLV
jgi:tetratricopeptide (TPR) repeat protein